MENFVVTWERYDPSLFHWYHWAHGEVKAFFEDSSIFFSIMKSRPYYALQGFPVNMDTTTLLYLPQYAECRYRGFIDLADFISAILYLSFQDEHEEVYTDYTAFLERICPLSESSSKEEARQYRLIYAFDTHDLIYDSSMAGKIVDPKTASETFYT